MFFFTQKLPQIMSCHRATAPTRTPKHYNIGIIEETSQQGLEPQLKMQQLQVEEPPVESADGRP